MNALASNASPRTNDAIERLAGLVREGFGTVSPYRRNHPAAGTPEASGHRAEHPRTGWTRHGAYAAWAPKAGVGSTEPRASSTVQTCRGESVGDAGLRSLVLALSRGDAAAFRELHDRTQLRLRTLAVRMLGDRHRADDALQDAYVSIWKHAGAYRPEQSSPITWMSAIVRNRCLDVLRHPAREVFLEQDDHAGDVWDRLATVQASGETPYEGEQEEAERIHGALDSLPGCYRQALMLAHGHECSHAEIAERLGIPLGTAKSWVRRGLEALRAAYFEGQQGQRGLSSHISKGGRGLEFRGSALA